jgi:hypothetical protein
MGASHAALDRKVQFPEIAIFPWILTEFWVAREAFEVGELQVQDSFGCGGGGSLLGGAEISCMDVELCVHENGRMRILFHNYISIAYNNLSFHSFSELYQHF